MGRGAQARGRRVAPLVLAAAAVAAGAASAAVVLTSGHEEDREVVAALGLLVGWSFTGTGAFAWWRRPGNARAR